jgi:predicted NBD/HSP70 family sugar kinase
MRSRLRHVRAGLAISRWYSALVTAGRATPVPRASERLVVQSLERRGSLTRRELAEDTGLPVSTITGAVSRLVAKAMVREVRQDRREPTGKGRPETMLSLLRDQRVIGSVVLYPDHVSTEWSRDWGYHVRAACVTENGQILSEAPLVAKSWPQDMVEQVIALLRQVRAGLPKSQQLDQVVLGLPLPYRQGHGYTSLQVDQPQPIDWMTSDLAALIQRATGIDTYVDNSCRLATLAELSFGAARTYDNVVYLQLVGGSNCGIVAEGRLIRGSIDLAGEISHLHVKAGGPYCPCGNRGCLGVTVQNSDSLIEGIRSLYSDITDVYQILGLAAQGAPHLRGLLRELGEVYGQHLAAGCILLNPELIVVDGSLGPALAPVVAGIREGLQRHLPDAIYASMNVVGGHFGAEAAIIGASQLAGTLQSRSRSRSRVGNAN